MGCFPFLNGDKKEEHKNTQPISIDSSRSSLNVSIFSERDPKRSESDFSSQNISDISIDSGKRSLNPSFSNRRSNLREFRFHELKAVTRNFNRSHLIGEGGFGCVYRGSIKCSEDPSKKIDVAVKKLNGGGWQGHKEWITEVNVLGVVEHPNLVKLVGYCAEDDERGTERLLVYEYMPNLSVEHHLLSQTETPLPWSMRLKIAQDSARGLVYLHEEMEFQIIFRDFKPSNILLDEQWNAKLSDFGLARLGPSEGLTHVSTAAIGTFGYAAPEYVQTGRLTSKNDVYSYGVFLYVLITGRHPMDRMRPKDEQKLLEWIRPYLTDAKKFRMIIDPRLEGKYSLKSVQKVTNLASQCLTRQPKLRPKMSELLENINRIVDESAGTGSPQLDPKKSSEMAQVDNFKNNRKILDMKNGENSWFSWIWRPKVWRTLAKKDERTLAKKDEDVQEHSSLK